MRRIEYFNLYIVCDMQISTKKGATLMIDVWFDCRQDTNGKDPDAEAPKQSAHRHRRASIINGFIVSSTKSARIVNKAPANREPHCVRPGRLRTKSLAEVGR